MKVSSNSEMVRGTALLKQFGTLGELMFKMHTDVSNLEIWECTSANASDAKCPDLIFRNSAKSERGLILT